MARWGLLNCSLGVLRSAGRAAPAEAEPSIEATLGAMNRAEDMVEVVRCQLRSGGGGLDKAFLMVLVVQEMDEVEGRQVFPGD